jgi:phosphoserine phosphatase
MFLFQRASRSLLLPSKQLSRTMSAAASGKETVAKLMKNATAVCFDVDSTVCINEGLDDLADFCGAGEKVAAWTNKAMGGSVPFEVALKERLELFRPSKDDVDRFLAAHPPTLTDGVHEFMDALRARGTAVYLISGGFVPLIVPAATTLGIPETDIYANSILHNAETGEYEGFDDTAFTSRSGGKPRAVDDVISRHGGGDDKIILMVGDGATDLEAKPPAKAVIGFGGIVTRDVVKEKSDWFINDFQEAINALKE